MIGSAVSTTLRFFLLPQVIHFSTPSYGGCDIPRCAGYKKGARPNYVDGSIPDIEKDNSRSANC
jgi:hypothetical protein